MWEWMASGNSLLGKRFGARDVAQVFGVLVGDSDRGAEMINAGDSWRL
jgi:hypothetical protein